MKRSTSSGRGAAQSQQAASDMIRLRKELIQTRSKVTDLQDELEEKTSLYLNAIKMRDQYSEKLNNARTNITKVDEIVQHQVQAALDSERREMTRTKNENDTLLRKVDALDNENKTLQVNKQQLLEKITGLEEDLAFYSRNQDVKESIKRIDLLRREKEEKDKKINQLMGEINTLSNLVDDMTAENRQLRRMANVPDNYGIPLETIKLYDKERIEDYKKLIKVLQDDNYKLEEERANLKHQLKLQAMMYKSNDTDPRLRYKGLSDDQLRSVDDYVVRLLQGNAHEPADFYKLKKDNEQLQAKLDMIQNTGFEALQKQIQSQMAGLGGNSVTLNQTMGSNLNQDQLNKLMTDNEKLRIMVEQLLKQGVTVAQPIPGHAGPTPIPQDFERTFKPGQFRPPQPHEAFDNEITGGISHKFGGTQLPVHNKDGKQGINASNVYEHAFLQLQLKEVYEVNHRLNDQVSHQKREIESLYKKIRGYLLTQDQLYKDCVRMERTYQKKEESLRETMRRYELTIQEEKDKYSKVENALKALSTNDQQAVQNKLIELTKQNSILDLNLLRLTRKYTNLEEQEKMLRREYHAKDSDMAEKDRFVQQRINSLKEWKANAMTQLQFLFQKLRIAVPMSELQGAQKNLEMEKQRTSDFSLRNAKMAEQISKLQRQNRENDEAEEKLKAIKDDKEALEEEFEIIKKRLEGFDPMYKWENAIYQKIANMLKRAGVSPLQAFEAFDEDKNGQLTKVEFLNALEEKMRVYDLSHREAEILYNSLDSDKSGSINYREFVRKLEQYGVKNLGREEFILYQLAKTMQKTNMTMAEFFEMMDKSRRGYISREDFKDLFENLGGLKLNESELNQFIDNFWRDKIAGIDYKGFLRIFAKYEIKVQEEQNSKRGGRQRTVIKDETIRVKKSIFDELQVVFKQVGKDIKDLFKQVDSDKSFSISVDELFGAFKSMNLDVNLTQTHQIFDSIDFDGNGSLTLPELVADFNDVINNPVETLVQRNQQETRDIHEAQGNFDVYGLGDTMGIPDSQAKEIQMQTRISVLESREKRLQKRLTDAMQIVRNSEQSCHYLQQQNDGLERENTELQLTSSQLKERVSMLEAAQAHSMRKEDAENMVQQNEKLITELAETRAAMLSYKNMCQVIADQAKNLKLIQERKKDEHENLLEALREMQSEGATKERVGKLYFIIMLSRWQEASVNKKYEAVISEVKDLRNELINSQALCSAREVQIEKQENDIREGCQTVMNLQHEVQMKKGEHSAIKVQELDRIIQDLSDDKTRLEDEHFHTKGEFREAKDLLDAAMARADQAESLRDMLQNDFNDQKSQSLIEMSKKLQADRLDKYRLKRENQELQERSTYLSRLVKNKDEAVFSLEEKAAKLEGDVHRIQEEYRQIDNDRQKKFFRQRFDAHSDQLGRGNVAQGGPGGIGRPGQTDVARRLETAAGLTNTQTQRISEKDLGREMERQQRSMRAETHAAGGADWTMKAELEQKDSQISKLEQQLKDQQNALASKENEVSRLRMWQEGDKYLSEDLVLKDAIEDHRLKTLAIAQKEQKEVQDAAYQTVKTLQDMIEQKNEQLKRKEENIERLRSQMTNQAQLDATTINELREKISATGGNTLTKLHQIVAQHDARPQESQHNAHTQNANNAAARQALDEVKRELQEKDRVIQKLRAGTEGVKQERQVNSQKLAELRNEIAALKDELRREKERVDLKAANKKLLRLQKERTDQDKVITNLRKAIDLFEERMLKYESEKVQMVEKNVVADKKESFQQMEAEKERKSGLNKIKMIENQRNKLTEECKELKVAISRKDEELQAMRAEKDAASQKHQNVLTELNQERRDKTRVANELNRYQEEQKIGGNLGGAKLSYAALEDRNRELERDIKILEAQKATVVTKNQEFGTFEYIGAPMPLNGGNPSDEPKSLADVVARMTAWLKKHDRVSVGGIMRSLDRGGFGELRESEFAKACERMGISLSASNMRMLKSVLDHRSTGYLKYGPLVQQLAGMPAKEFLDPAIEKLAELVRSKDYLPNDFKQLLDARGTGQLKAAEFKTSLQSLRSTDFSIYDEEIDKVFLMLTKQARVSSTATASVDELTTQVYNGVKAVMICMMQSGLKKSRRSLADLVAARDVDRDGYLEYQQFEDMLLEDMQVGFYPKLFESIIIAELLDTGKRLGKIKNDLIKMYLGEGESSNMVVDMVPSQENQRARKGTGAAGQGAGGAKSRAGVAQAKMLQSVSRKVLMGFQGSLGDTLNKEDTQGDGLLPVDTVTSIIQAKQIAALQPSELTLLLASCDSQNYGFLIIQNFHDKLLKMAQETEIEVKLRRFAKSIGNQGLNLKAELSQLDRLRKGELDSVQFKRAMKQMAVPLTDPEIKELYETGLELSPNGGSGLLDITRFCQKVSEVQRSKPLPAYMNAAAKPGSKVGSRIGAGVRSAMAGGNAGEVGSQFENWEIEKKYKRNLEALKQEIEERNNEILLVKKEVANCNARVLKLEGEKQELENKLIDKNAKPPRQMQTDSEHIGNLDEIQKLRDRIFHLQQVNTALQKTMDVGLKAELGKALQEKDILEEKLKQTAEKLRNRTHEVQMLMGQPMDAIAQRENIEESRQKRIEELEKDLVDHEQRSSLLQEQLFQAEEKNLDLKFEKETFDLQYARLQKRITDLEQYKLQSSQISANLKNQREEELAAIKEQTQKITGEQFSSQGDSVKLRNRKLKSVAELETVIDTLRRVIDKQKVEMDTLRKDNSQMHSKVGNEHSAQEAAQLRRKVEGLEQALHSAEMREVNSDEQERTMKKLIFANKQLREDLSREIERYNLLENKFRDLLVKYNLTQKENEKNQKLVFALGTGAQLPRFDNFLDDEGAFSSNKKKKKSGYGASGLDYSPEDSLNKVNRKTFDDL